MAKRISDYLVTSDGYNIVLDSNGDGYNYEVMLFLADKDCNVVDYHAVLSGYGRDFYEANRSLDDQIPGFSANEYIKSRHAELYDHWSRGWVSYQDVLDFEVAVEKAKR